MIFSSFSMRSRRFFEDGAVIFGSRKTRKLAPFAGVLCVGTCKGGYSIEYVNTLLNTYLIRLLFNFFTLVNFLLRFADFT